MQFFFFKQQEKVSKMSFFADSPQKISFLKKGVQEQCNDMTAKKY
jgi:hypothetical protein